jgi:hypothetical protein
MSADTSAGQAADEKPEALIYGVAAAWVAVAGVIMALAQWTGLADMPAAYQTCLVPLSREMREIPTSPSATWDESKRD